ncbi:GHMP kinase [Fibrobacterota bacterium]
MIISRTPFRVSFAGGGSDLKPFYEKNGYGAVVSAAIKRYMYIVIHPYFHDKIRIKYSQTEDVHHVDDIKHPIVRECLRKVDIDKGIEIASFADIPAGTGLGSSSAFTVGLLNALYAYGGRIVPKKELAAQACEIEIDILGEPIGKQDQYAAACGDLNHIRFNRDESVDVSPLLLTEQKKLDLEDRLCLYHVGGTRRTADVLPEQKKNISVDEKYQNMRKMVGLADELKEKLQLGNSSVLGDILDKGWHLKKELASGITNDTINGMYEKSQKLGAWGGKLLGAGGTGFLLLYAEDHRALNEKMQCRTVPFHMDREGTKILFYD